MYIHEEFGYFINEEIPFFPSPIDMKNDIFEELIVVSNEESEVCLLKFLFFFFNPH